MTEAEAEAGGVAEGLGAGSARGEGHAWGAGPARQAIRGLECRSARLLSRLDVHASGNWGRKRRGVRRGSEGGERETREEPVGGTGG